MTGQKYVFSPIAFACLLPHSKQTEYEKETVSSLVATVSKAGLKLILLSMVEWIHISTYNLKSKYLSNTFL